MSAAVDPRVAGGVLSFQRSNDMNLRRTLPRSAVLAAVVMSVGCGDGRTKMGVAPTVGTVICEGKPVPYVAVFFEPMAQGKNANAGKQGIGHCDDKGHFVLTTYDTDDGAVVGKHRVKVGPPMGEPRPGFKCDCALNTESVVTELDVKEGQNTFEIKLVKATRRDKQLEAQEAARNKED
jgi:hypothetical protein